MAKKRPENDLEVQPDRPFFDTAVIEFHASLHFVNRVGPSPRQPLTCASPVMPGLIL